MRDAVTAALVAALCLCGVYLTLQPPKTKPTFINYQRERYPLGGAS